jgi:hypothetical protein
MDDNYFDDCYQGIPKNGYTELFEKLLDGIEVRLNTDYFSDRENFDSMAKKVVYAGPIDEFFNFSNDIFNIILVSLHIIIIFIWIFFLFNLRFHYITIYLFV